MRSALLVALALGACRESGTIDVVLDEPCDDATFDRAAVYLVQGTNCDAIACGLANFTCDLRAGCSAACESGYCTADELHGLSLDPEPGDYALVISFHYADRTRDAALACYVIHVDADGEQSHTESDGGRCCREM